MPTVKKQNLMFFVPFEEFDMDTHNYPTDIFPIGKNVMDGFAEAFDVLVSVSHSAASVMEVVPSYRDYRTSYREKRNEKMWEWEASHEGEDIPSDVYNRICEDVRQEMDGYTWDIIEVMGSMYCRQLERGQNANCQGPEFLGYGDFRYTSLGGLKFHLARVNRGDPCGVRLTFEDVRIDGDLWNGAIEAGFKPCGKITDTGQEKIEYLIERHSGLFHYDEKWFQEMMNEAMQELHEEYKGLPLPEGRSFKKGDFVSCPAHPENGKGIVFWTNTLFGEKYTGAGGDAGPKVHVFYPDKDWTEYNEYERYLIPWEPKTYPSTVCFE